LRQDNADLRLTPIGYEAGLISEDRYKAFLAKKELEGEEIERLEHTFLSPSQANAFLTELGEPALKSGASLADLLRRPPVTYRGLAAIDPTRPALPTAVTLTVEVQIKYAGYANRQLAEVERHKKLEQKKLPEDLNYQSIRGLRLEAAQKLEKIRPKTLGQASRISGVNPADISVLLIYLGMK
jgi:tRNA uridine 5-carboxymethylaminomethyl modification enzyme